LYLADFVCVYLYAVHSPIKTSRHQDIKTSRHQDIKTVLGVKALAEHCGPQLYYRSQIRDSFNNTINRGLVQMSKNKKEIEAGMKKLKDKMKNASSSASKESSAALKNAEKKLSSGKKKMKGDLSTLSGKVKGVFSKD
jgi:hypothetical protein